MRYIWLIPLLPAFGAAVNGLVGIRAFSRQVSGLVACATMTVALGLSLVAFWQLLGLPEDARAYEVTLGPWLPSIPLETADGIKSFNASWAFRLDPLAGLMALVVTLVGTLIHIYSLAYMVEESRGGYARFFSYLNLFCFFMLMLVLGSNFLVMFVGWEGVGLCSYLLIGYWYEKKSAADAGKKAFVTNRIGDWGFILGLFLVFYTFGTLDIRAVQDAAAARPIESAEFGVLSAICLLLFIGAIGKSAQIPLYVWLPDAMEGPTPVSALIHAATMVTAGVYMVGRNAVLFSHAPMVMEIVAIVGVLTALMAASIGLVQYDIKRVLAYSTVSQLGYMFTALGVGAFAAGAFHLMTHAFFKALLFLGSGSVIHALAGEQDMRRMGGLKKHLPVTFLVMMVGTLAIAGIPPLSGFFSKDEILYRTFLGGGFFGLPGGATLMWALAVGTALMTAFYMFRLMSLTFYGVYRGPAWATAAHGSPGGHGGPAAGGHAPAPTPGGGAGHDAPGGGGHGHAAWHGPHESPRLMTVPLMALAAGAVLAGLVGIPAALGGGNAIEHFLEPSFVASAAHGEPLGGTGALQPSEPGAAARVEAGEPRAGEPAAATGTQEIEHASVATERVLMVFSVIVALAGIFFARHVYVRRPELSERLAERWAGAHRTLLNKYYVDELYNSTVIAGTVASARRLWTFDRRVVDGGVNGTGWATLFSSWVSGLTDRFVVDGAVNLVGSTTEESSYWFRRLQTGLVQNYALLMVFGVFVFVGVYLLLR